jgi:hypothetical protein
MRMNEASELRRKYKDQGSPLCNHSYTEKEYTDIGSNTGDRVCTSCGLAAWNMKDFEKDYQKQLKRL